MEVGSPTPLQPQSPAHPWVTLRSFLFALIGLERISGGKILLEGVEGGGGPESSRIPVNRARNP